MSLPRLMLRAGRAVLDVLLPPGCAGCDAVVESPGQLCANCFRQMVFVTEPSCGRCGLPFASEDEAGEYQVCAACLARPPSWRRARAALVYDEAARRLILPLKHAGRQENAAVLGRHMARAGAALLTEAKLLVPVPLHRWRLLHRRYNQAALLAQVLAKKTGFPAGLDVLRRSRATQKLADLSPRARAAQLAGAIQVRKTWRQNLPGQAVLLIDDVLTSGATANACACALLDAGAASVDVLVASRVPDRRDKDTER